MESMYQVDKDHTIKILQNLVKLKAYEVDINLQIEQLEEDAAAPLSPMNYDEKGGQTYKISSATENAAVDHIDRSKILKYKLRTITITTKRITNSLEALPALEKNLVKLRIIEDKHWDDIYEMLEYKSYKYLKERLDHALDIVGLLINDIDIDYLLRCAVER